MIHTELKSSLIRKMLVALLALFATATYLNAQAQQFPPPPASHETSHGSAHGGANHSYLNHPPSNHQQQNSNHQSATPNQMSNMLDEVASGKSPTLPARAPNARSFLPKPGHGSIQAQYPGYSRTSLLNQRGINRINFPPINHASMSQSRNLPGGGIVRPGGMSGLGYGSAMGMGLGAGAMAHGMRTMGGGSRINGEKAALLMQQFKQKFAGMQPQEGGEGGQANPFAGMPGNPLAGLGESSIQRPSAQSGGNGGGFNIGSMFGQQPQSPQMQGPASMQSMFGQQRQAAAPPAFNQQRPQSGDFIKRPPGMGAITNGASSTSSSSSAHGTSASDLERQMEQQYGR